MSNNEKNTPVHKIQHGYIEAAIWKNTGEKRDFYSVTFSRNYRSNESWNSSNSFSGSDLLLLAKAADDAYSWIHAQESTTA